MLRIKKDKLEANQIKSAKDILGRSILKKRKPSANNAVVSVAFHWVTKNI